MRTNRSIHDDDDDRDLEEETTPVYFKITDVPFPLDLGDYLQVHPDLADPENPDNWLSEWKDYARAWRAAQEGMRASRAFATRRARLDGAARRRQRESIRTVITPIAQNVSA
jgi:hypothetical protein